MILFVFFAWVIFKRCLKNCSALRIFKLAFNTFRIRRSWHFTDLWAFDVVKKGMKNCFDGMLLENFLYTMAFIAGISTLALKMIFLRVSTERNTRWRIEVIFALVYWALRARERHSRSLSCFVRLWNAAPVKTLHFPCQHNENFEALFKSARNLFAMKFDCEMLKSLNKAIFCWKLIEMVAVFAIRLQRKKRIV